MEEDMFPITKEEIKELIKEGKAAKKDVSDLEKYLAKNNKILSCKKSSSHKKIIGNKVIMSTGPVNEEDFE